MPVKKGDNVKVDYTGKLDDGTVFDSSTHGDHSHPLEFEAGAGQMIKGFDDAVIGMDKGDEKSITLKPEEAYGQPNPQMVQKVPRDKFPEDIQKGAQFVIQTPQGQIPATVAELDDKEVKVDLNHPLAGKTLHFDLKVIEIA